MFCPIPTHRLQLTLAGAMLAPLALGACVVRVDSNDFRAREEKRFQVTGAPEINLTTFDGPIDVRGWDREEVFVEVEKRGREKEAVEQIEVVSEQKGNRITLEARQPGGKKYAFGMLTAMSRSAKLIASVPRGSNIILRTGDGSISIEQVKGRIELRTNDGSITGLDLSGDLLARTDDGGVRLNSLDGRADVVTGDGSITLDGRFDFVRARTNDGSVSVKVMPGSMVRENWSLMTGDGNAIIYLPDGLSADLDAESSQGHTRVDQALRIHTDGEGGKTMLRGTIGEGGGNLRIRTVDGHIYFKRLPFKLRAPDSERTQRMERMDRLEKMERFERPEPPEPPEHPEALEKPEKPEKPEPPEPPERPGRRSRP
jgi:hypothetical protein